MKLSGKLQRSFFVLLAVLIAGAGASIIFPGTALADQGLKLSNGIFQAEVVGGQVLAHVMSVKSNISGGGLTIRVEARGFGQGTDGAYEPLTAAEDTAPFSARKFITNIEPSSFYLEPGETRDVTVTITIPSALDNGTYYAIVYVHTDEIDTQGSAIVLAANAPVILIPRDTIPVDTGEIETLALADVEAGQPLHFLTGFRNTGNQHFKALNRIVMTDSDGHEIVDVTSPLTTSSIVRSFSYVFDTAVTPASSLSTGNYHVISEVYNENGSLLDVTETDVELTLPWEIFPPVIVEESLETFVFTDEPPGEIDATAKSNLRIEFTGIDNVTGSVITARYDGEPKVSIAFTTEPDKGGAGGSGILFSAIHTEGFIKGTVQIDFLYTDADIQDFDENSLFLTYWDGSQWRSMENIRVYSGANYVSGAVDVTKLVGAPVGLGGVSVNGAASVSIWIWIGLGAIIMAAVAALSMVLVRRRKNN